MRHSRFLLSAASALIAFSPVAYAEDGRLTGGWNGHRAAMEEMGVTADAIYKLDVMSNVSGGLDEGTVLLDNLDVVVGLDGEKLFGSKGTSALIHFLNNNGGAIDGGHVGSAQGIDNIEVEDDSSRLYQAWIQQNFMDDKLSLLAGLYDLNSEFYVTDSSMLFMHSTFGIGTDIAQSGGNGPSIFPVTSLAGRVRVQPTPEWYLQGVVLDGVPGDPDHIEGTQISLGHGDGALLVAEGGYTPEGAKLGLGVWRYTASADDVFAVDALGNPLRHHNQGIYAIGEKQLCENLTGFAHLGFADEDVNQFDYAWSTGLVYQGLFPGREEGLLGLGLYGAHNGDSFRDAVAAAGGSADSAELGLELTYNDNLTSWLTVQPDVQYVINPGTDPSLDNALVLGSRFAVAF